jgi:hypothetical protein
VGDKLSTPYITVSRDVPDLALESWLKDGTEGSNDGRDEFSRISRHRGTSVIAIALRTVAPVEQKLAGG